MPRLPILLRRLVLAALLLTAGPAWADPALWVAHGPRATVYLLGSVHLLRPGTEWQGPAIRRALNEAEECWFEAVQSDATPALQAMVVELGFDFHHKLTDLLSESVGARLEAVAEAGGVPIAQLQVMRPWLAALSLAVGPLMRAGFDPELGVDKVLQGQAEAEGKPVHGFETLEQQMRFLAGMPAADGLRLLEATITDVEGGPDKLDEMVARWNAGDHTAGEALAALLREAFPDLHATLLINRNVAWTRAISAMLEGDRTVLVTVGAAHLPGPDGVVELLRRQGVRVDMVPP